MLKTGCMEQVSKSKDPLGLLSATLNRITITVTRAKGTSNPFSLNVLSLAARCYELPGPFKQTFLSYLVTKAIWKKQAVLFVSKQKGRFEYKWNPDENNFEPGNFKISNVANGHLYSIASRIIQRRLIGKNFTAVAPRMG